ncbi:hypothetical protein L6452_30842 [Arctium lappa]|uniref:Uncharacterized protein n=1 Tax=Arctium lappa TaxID=4217 RepID=A0ACB8ZJA4_ARCLA|nr:hypothetical protein L6452_30842 [Arctium lappa]
MSVAHVPSLASDKSCTSSFIIDQGTIQHILRSGPFSGEAQLQSSAARASRLRILPSHLPKKVPSSPQPPVQDTAPPNGYRNDPVKASTPPWFPPGLCPPQVIIPIAPYPNSPLSPPTASDPAETAATEAGPSAEVGKP